MRVTGLLVVATVLVQLAQPRDSYAYKLEPISRVFAPSGSEATQSFEIINNEPGRIALTVSIQTLAVDESYHEINADAEDEFLVYPPQLVLSPGKHQTLRVTWLGDAKPTRELTFRIVVRQVPIAMLDKTAAPSDAAGGVKILLSYRGTLFVRPPGAKPKIGVEVKPLDNQQLALTLVNRGNAVGLVKSCTVTLQGTGTTVEVPSTALASLRNNRVLAGGRRRFTVPWPVGASPLKAVGACVVEP